MTSCALHLIDGAEVTEAFGDLTDGFGTGCGDGSNVIKVEDTGEQFKLAAVEKERDTGRDGGGTGTV
jgi:hypothetical protein